MENPYGCLCKDMFVEIFMHTDTITIARMRELNSTFKSLYTEDLWEQKFKKIIKEKILEGYNWEINYRLYDLSDKPGTLYGINNLYSTFVPNNTPVYSIRDYSFMLFPNKAKLKKYTNKKIVTINIRDKNDNTLFFKVHWDNKITCVGTCTIDSDEDMIEYDDNLRTAYHERLYDCRIAGITCPYKEKKKSASTPYSNKTSYTYVPSF